MTTVMRNLTIPVPIVCIMVIVLTAIACDSDENPSVSSDTESNSSETIFIQTVEAAKNDAIGITEANQGAATEIEGVTEADPQELDPPGTTIVFSSDRNINEMPVKDVDVVANEVAGNVGISAEDEISLQIIALENRLMEIWDSSINGVVLITLENSLYITDGTGAGWFWDDQGHIVTNHHVVQPTSPFGSRLGGTNTIWVETFEGSRHEAEIVGSDPVADIAVIKIAAEPDTYHLIPVGNSANLRPGMATIALGHPFGAGQAFSMTHGIISGLARSIQSGASTIPTSSVL